MKKFILKRLLTTLVLLFIVSSIVFLLIHLIPGDPVLLMLGTDSTPDPAAVESLRKQLGFDKPLLVQYYTWLINALQGNLGTSYSEHIPVIQSIASRLPRTLELAFVSLILSCLVGIPLGVFSALRRGKISDLLMTTVASIGTSIPVYVVGYMLIIIFSLDSLGLGFSLPSSGYMNLSRSVSGHFLRLILPAITLALGLAASIVRMMRSSMLEALSSESVRALRAKGLSERKVIVTHVIRNAFIPVITVIGLQMGSLIGGTVLAETVFNWPGLATLLVKAINQRDYPLIQGCVLIMSAVFIITNLVVDILYGILEPRVR
ncbi:ABC transporter permease [Clostridium magnum]|uniref:Glutathione transport system permease protein GsiC n=1 Tax=Clostridium magnum DSM 2767 TaxID=1121326 RepID=A0A162QUZ7_9CLOT|nr:ABC transporter permease [Clostridium magnum]KZL89003.1 glutathione transport system permease protein GsiC [Clostridium magnum DSM 2767]SHI23376.1 peptide/nickel transport system permease protein [Clostridium magnum DSM 2767]